jgi:hypothetical protein
MEHIPSDDVGVVIDNILSSADTVFFQISTVSDIMGKMFGHDLHLTVRPHQWWQEVLSEYGEVTLSEDHGVASIFIVKRVKT